jgi:hypothetical protein
MSTRRPGLISAGTRLLIALGGLLLTLAAAAVAAAVDTRPPHTAPAATVHVAIVAKGDVGQYAGMCGAPGGTDSLDGHLTLRDQADDGSALYAGPAMRYTQVVACGTKPAPTEDQVAMCSARLTGEARMDVTLEVYPDDRGAWVKSEPVQTRKKQIGGCPEASEWLDTYPADGLMSGLELDGVPSGPLQSGDYVTGNVTLHVY